MKRPIKFDSLVEVKLPGKISKQSVRALIIGGLVATIVSSLFYRTRMRKLENSVMYMSDARTQNDLIYLTPMANEVLKGRDDLDMYRLKWHLTMLLNITVNRAQESDQKAGVIPGLAVFGEQPSFLDSRLIVAAAKAVRQLEEEEPNRAKARQDE